MNRVLCMSIELTLSLFVRVLSTTYCMCSVDEIFCVVLDFRHL